jgi:hypothetical protein
VQKTKLRAKPCGFANNDLSFQVQNEKKNGAGSGAGRKICWRLALALALEKKSSGAWRWRCAKTKKKPAPWRWRLAPPLALRPGAAPVKGPAPKPCSRLNSHTYKTQNWHKDCSNITLQAWHQAPFLMAPRELDLEVIQAQSTYLNIFRCEF